ncbi:MAG: lipoprotein signal peptidase, partial [Porphyromonadaceae bacterium]|nr:lipoprotein signal peptidase [Porphyromonadaceae bacterium]
MTSSKGTSKALALCSGLILLLLIIDQAFKIWVKTSMVEGEMIEIASWFK